MIRTKRWNDPREPEDGYRLLVTRYRPRGVARAGEPWDVWCPELAPSQELLAAFHGKDAPPISWNEYRTRYVNEMSSRGFFLRGSPNARAAAKRSRSSARRPARTRRAAIASC